MINRFSNHGIVLTGSTATGNVIAGNYIGVAADGVTARPNAGGVLVSSGAANNTIGRRTTAIQQVVSSGGSFSNPSGMAVRASDGVLFVADPTSASGPAIIGVNPTTGGQSVFSTNGLLVRPNQIALGACFRSKKINHFPLTDLRSAG